MNNGYHVECDSDGCERCGQGASFTVVDPSDIASGTSWMDKGAAEDHCYELNEAYKKGLLAGQARLSSLRVVYDRYHHEDAWIMDPLFLLGDSHRSDHLMIRALWEAVKAAVEGEGK